MDRAIRVLLVTFASMTLLGAAACSGSDGDDDESTESASADQFLGVWEYDSGSGSVTCGSDTSSYEVSGSLEFVEGADADLLLKDEDCNMGFNISGDTASVVPGESCSQTSDNTTITLTPTSWDYRVSGNSMTETGSGNATVESGGNTVDCTFNQSGSLTKQGG